LRELRPALHLQRYTSLADLSADSAASHDLVFIPKNAMQEGFADSLSKHLKAVQVHVVMDHCEYQNPSAAEPGHASVRDDCKLTALLALLDDMNRATEQ
jgi:hypothetical protein